jgi:hypothetical protein
MIMIETINFSTVKAVQTVIQSPKQLKAVNVKCRPINYVPILCRVTVCHVTFDI